jgi:antitoxin CptB
MSGAGKGIKPMENDESGIRRILWRCRRGTRELDILLGGFAAKNYRALADRDRQLFAELLEQQDTVLTAWLVYHQPPDERFASLVERVLKSGVSV